MVRSYFLLKAKTLKVAIMMGSQKAEKGTGYELKTLTIHQITEPTKYEIIDVKRYMLVFLEKSNLRR